MAKINMIFKRISPSILNEPDDSWLFQHVRDHVAGLLGDQWFDAMNVEKLHGIPLAAKNVWYLWGFSARVQGEGMSGWVGNCAPHAPEIIAVHAALKLVGVSELLELLEASFELATKECFPEFLREPEAPWFAQFKGNPKWPSLEGIDIRTYELVGKPLAAIVANYIRENRAEL